MVIKLHYGWETNPLTLREIGNLLDISPSRVSQIEYKGLVRIRKHLTINNPKPI